MSRPVPLALCLLALATQPAPATEESPAGQTATGSTAAEAAGGAAENGPAPGDAAVPADSASENAAADELANFTPALAEPTAPLSLFQWSLKTGGALVLVPHEDHLYPAKRLGEGVIETLPLKIEVELHADGRRLSVPLDAVRAPQEVLDGSHVLERRAGDDWLAVPAMHFHDTTFYGQEAPGPFVPYELGEIRLRRR